MIHVAVCGLCSQHNVGMDLESGDGPGSWGAIATGRNQVHFRFMSLELRRLEETEGIARNERYKRHAAFVRDLGKP